MPSTVTDLFDGVDLIPGGVVRWGQPVPEGAQGVYVVSLDADPDSRKGCLSEAPIELERLEHLLAVRPELSLDGRRPTAEEFSERLASFWLPDEVVVYIGLSGQPLRTRVRQYYKTKLGANRPHAGGWWLKSLSVLDELWVHFAATPRYESAETTLLQNFAASVTPAHRLGLHDSGLVAPFANLRTGTGTVKHHGLRGATGELGASGLERQPASPAAMPVPPQTPTAKHHRTRASGCVSQRVTVRDLEAGRLRFPRKSKALFPAERDYVEVSLRGNLMTARWDPRTGPDRERSGLLSFGRSKLDGIVEVGDILDVAGGRDGAAVKLS